MYYAIIDIFMVKNDSVLHRKNLNVMLLCTYLKVLNYIDRVEKKVQDLQYTYGNAYNYKLNNNIVH